MSRTLQLEIVTPDRVVLSKMVEYVSVTGIEGEFGVLPGHVPLLSVLKIGPLHYMQDGKTKYLCISGGFAEVTADKVLILADSAETTEEINVQRAGASRKRAEERIAKACSQGASKPQEAIDMARAEAALARAANRLKLAGL